MNSVSRTSTQADDTSNVCKTKPILGLQKHTVTLLNPCSSPVATDKVINYEEALKDDDIGQQATEALSNLTNLVLKEASRLAFKTQLSKLPIETYLGSFLQKNLFLSSLASNLFVLSLRFRVMAASMASFLTTILQRDFSHVPSTGLV